MLLHKNIPEVHGQISSQDDLLDHLHELLILCLPHTFKDIVSVNVGDSLEVVKVMILHE